MIGWWRRRKHAIALARAEATAFMHDFGDQAYYEARRRALETRWGTLFDGRPKGTGIACGTRSRRGPIGTTSIRPRECSTATARRAQP